MTIKVNSKTALVFDLDDTLYNEIDYLRSAFLAIAKKLEPKEWDFLFSYMFALYKNKGDVFGDISKKYDTNKNQLIEVYRNHSPEITLFNGAEKLMTQIKKEKGKIGIITDGRSLTQNKKIDALGIRKFIDYAVISEEIGSEKPDEANFLKIENVLNCDTYYYIGDNFKKDFIAPNKLGWKTIGLIDNSRNIHSNAHLHTNKKQVPQNLIFNLNDLKIN
jgi:putative hydrolase of the HAD superfamily